MLLKTRRTDATADMQGFWADVIKARQKWKIADFVGIVSLPVEGEDQTSVSMFTLGNLAVAPLLIMRAALASVTDLVSTINKADKANSEKGD